MFLIGDLGAYRQVGAQSGLRGVDLLIGKLVLRAVLNTGAAPTKKCARTTNVGHSLCPKKCFEDLRFLMLLC